LSPERAVIGQRHTRHTRHTAIEQQDREESGQNDRSHLASSGRLPYASASVLFSERSPMQPQRHVRLFRNGRTQTLRIPHEFELDADEATIRRDGERLIVEPVKRRPDLASLLAGWEPLDEPFPDVDDIRL
jgi:antitoxin VapB